LIQIIYLLFKYGVFLFLQRGGKTIEPLGENIFEALILTAARKARDSRLTPKETS
jgi:hypothetical protein